MKDLAIAAAILLLGSFLTMNAFLIKSTIVNTTEIKAIGKAVNNVDPSEPTLRSIVVHINDTLPNITAQIADHEKRIAWLEK